MFNKKLASVAILAASLLAACSTGDNGTTSATTEEDQGVSEETTSSAATAEITPYNGEAVEITFWHTMGQTSKDRLDTYIDAFNEIYPNITITHTAQGGYDDLKSTISSSIAAGTVPTMAYCYPDHVAEYIDANNQVIDMTPYIEDETYGLGAEGTLLGDQGQDDYVQTYWNEGNAYSKNGTAIEGVYSLPYSKSTEVMFYNKTVFDAKGWTVPTTWDDMWELCATIKADPEYSDITPLGYDSDSNFFITLAEQKGYAYTTNTPGSDGYFLFNNDNVKNMVSELKGYYDLGYWTSQGTSSNNSYTSTLFTAQSLLMTIGSTGGTTYNYSDSFDVGVASLPQVDVNNGKVIMQGPSVCFFSRATGLQKTAAWLFYKFITNTNNSAYWSVDTGYNPVRTSSYSVDAYLNRGTTGSAGLVTSVAQYLADEDNGYGDWYFTSPAFKGSSTAREQVGSILSGVCLGTSTIDEAFTNAMTECLNAI